MDKEFSITVDIPMSTIVDALEKSGLLVFPAELLRGWAEKRSRCPYCSGETLEIDGIQIG